MIGAGPELARPLQRALRDVMWERCGVVRDDAGLRDGLARTRRDPRASSTTSTCARAPRAGPTFAQLIDLAAGLLVAEATVRGALARRESRGCHNRTDFPELDPALRVNFHTRLGDDGRLGRAVGRAGRRRCPTELEPWLVATAPSEVAGRLLE